MAMRVFLDMCDLVEIGRGPFGGLRHGDLELGPGVSHGVRGNRARTLRGLRHDVDLDLDLLGGWCGNRARTLRGIETCRWPRWQGAGRSWWKSGEDPSGD